MTLDQMIIVYQNGLNAKLFKITRPYSKEELVIMLTNAIMNVN